MDEVLTPDSSRFWSAPVNVGVEQPSFDKQFVRDYLTSNGLKGKEGVGFLLEFVLMSSDANLFLLG